MKIGAWLVLVGVLALPALSAAENEKNWSATVDLGYRGVSTDGNEDKYREDVNLDDGARLFDLDYAFRPSENTALDDFSLYASGLGGDPYTSAGLRARKIGRYDLRARYRSSDYFYRDAGYFFSDQGDLHTWNAERELADLRLKIEATDWLTVRVGADRMERTGGSTTSRRIGGSTTTFPVQQDVFVLARPVDQDASAYWVGADLRFGWADLVVEQRATAYENRWLLTASTTDGLETGGAFLDDYRLFQVQDADAPVSRILLAGTPTQRFRFSVGYSRIDAEVDYDVDGDWQGLDYTDAAFQTDLINTGTVERDSDLLDVELTYGVTPRLDIGLDYSHRSYDQNGDIDYLEQQSGGAGEGDYEIRGELSNELDLDTIDVTADWRLQKAWGFLFGAGFQTREADFALAGPEVETERTVYRAGVRYRPGPVANVSLTYEIGDDDDPYTPASPTDIDRIVLRGRLRPRERLDIGFHYKDETRENLLSYSLGMPTDDVPPATEFSTARFDVTSWGASLGWRADVVDLSIGYTRTEIDSNADIVYVTGAVFVPTFDITTTLDQTAYVADQDSVYASARFHWANRWHAGVLAAVTSNDGTFPLDWEHYQADLRYELGESLYLRAQYDRYSLDETNPYAGAPTSRDPDINDYDADIWTAAVGYRF
jgi:hypothetical protein